jgi:hypothetical protein
MPPTTESVSRNSLDETTVSILADETERQGQRTPTGPGTPYGRGSNIPNRARGNYRV